jgi:hypothetical protein
VDLPTYTNIWRIEKRLYKLYDFRLPMPLPVGQIAVFAAIAVPYTVALTVLGLHFSHTLLWLYVLPPGALAWLVTRPVLESKRLPELVLSQVRYLGEPRTWCRMAPLAEKDDVAITVRVWRQARREPAVVAEQSVSAAGAAVAGRSVVPAAAGAAVAGRSSVPARSRAAAAGQSAAAGLSAASAVSRAAGQRPPRPAEPGRGVAVPASWPGSTGRPALGAPAAGRHRAGAAAGAAGRVQQRPAEDAGDRSHAAYAAGHGQAQAEPPPVWARPAAPGNPAQHPAVPFVPAAATRPPAPWPHQAPGPFMDAAAAHSPAGPAEPTAEPRPTAEMPGPRPTAEMPGPRPAAERGRTADTPTAAPRASGAADRPHAADPVAVEHSEPPATPAATGTDRPVVTVTSEPVPDRPLRVVERALNGTPAHRGDGWRDHVVVVPGGHRPGRPDPQQRDRARAQLPVSGSRRIVVLGCTVGAGQTMTTLMTGEVLASLRRDPVAVLDLNPGSGSLAERAAAVPSLTQDSSSAPRGGQVPGGGQPQSRLEVISRAAVGAGSPAAGEDVGQMFELVSARYPLTLADPAASAVPRVLAVADQLILVAPASAEAASAIAMTYEWLEAHGRARLAEAAITVLNGVSRHTMRHVEQAETVASGRCRAIVRVPWDDQLRNPWLRRANPPGPAAQPGPAAGGALSPAAAHAYTALAGVLIVGLADAPELRRARI